MRFLICLSEKLSVCRISISVSEDKQLPVLNELGRTWRVHVCDLLNRFRQPAQNAMDLAFGRVDGIHFDSPLFIGRICSLQHVAEYRQLQIEALVFIVSVYHTENGKAGND